MPEKLFATLLPLSLDNFNTVNALVEEKIRDVLRALQQVNQVERPYEHAQMARRLSRLSTVRTMMQEMRQKQD